MPKKRNTKTTLKNKAWKVFSFYIRKSNADWKGYVKCISCGEQKDYKEMHAGHFQHNKLDFDEQNVNPQCVKCNTFKHGNLFLYGRALDKKYGKGTADKVYKKAMKHKGYTEEQLRKIYDKYKGYK